MDAVARNRLYWKCRRGLLELPDNDLWDIISGRSDDYDRSFEETVARLRAA